MGPTTVTNLKILTTVLATLGLYTWVANAIPQLESEVPEEVSFSGEVTAEELSTVGQDLFAGAGGCTACHGAGTRAPNLREDHEGEGIIGARCDTRAQEVGMTCKEYLYESMVSPGDYVVDGFNNIMPPQNRILTNNQIWALIAYLQSLGGTVTVTAEDLASGGGEATASAAGEGGGTETTEPMAIMQTNACLGCHIIGDQGVELGPELTDVGSRLSAEEIRASIVDPNAQASEGFESLVGTMPATFGQTLSDAQMDALVDFLAAQE